MAYYNITGRASPGPKYTDLQQHLELRLAWRMFAWQEARSNKGTHLLVSVFTHLQYNMQAQRWDKNKFYKGRPYTNEPYTDDVVVVVMTDCCVCPERNKQEGKDRGGERRNQSELKTNGEKLEQQIRRHQIQDSTSKHCTSKSSSL